MPATGAVHFETLHALRIDCKYLRYNLEFLRHLLGAEGEQLIAPLIALQDVLGELNDAVVSQQLLNMPYRGTRAPQPQHTWKRSLNSAASLPLRRRHCCMPSLTQQCVSAWDGPSRASSNLAVQAEQQGSVPAHFHPSNR